MHTPFTENKPPFVSLPTSLLQLLFSICADVFLILTAGNTLLLLLYFAIIQTLHLLPLLNSKAFPLPPTLRWFSKNPAPPNPMPLPLFLQMRVVVSLWSEDLGAE